MQTLRGWPRSPESDTSATHSSVSSHGMFGWSQHTHASCSSQKKRHRH